MTMLWKHYVFRRGAEVPQLWNSLFERRPVRLLYIAGRGFDIRAQGVMKSFVENLRSSGASVENSELLLVGFTGYQLGEELVTQTTENAAVLTSLFSTIGSAVEVTMSSSSGGEDDLSASNALRIGTERVLEHVNQQTDIVIDVSSLPRVVYLALLTGLLDRLITNRNGPNPLLAGGINLQVLVAEDPILDGRIQSEDPSNDLVAIPGFSGVLHIESVQDWPLVWFPILGENRRAQLEKVMAAAVPPTAEICPVLPHPSRDPRRADDLIVAYRVPLFDSRATPVSNILHANESNPFEAYRQLLKAMRRYRESMAIVGGCRILVTPLGSKLLTLGAGLACFEMRPATMDENYGVAISHAEPKRYSVSKEDLLAANPEISSLLLTGEAYAPGNGSTT